MTAYYNEIEPFAAEWLRRLIARNLIAPGEVDERSIVDVQPDDLRGYTQCHFFAGIGGWSYALRLAGWDDDRPVWTGSCPCQPFSAAGKQRGSDDERHLWPAFFRLIRECRPATVFGEQVAGAAGLAWLDHVCADLEESGYAVAAADLPACSVGAPHRRQRLWWVADAGCGHLRGSGLPLAGAARGSEGEGHQRERFRVDAWYGGDADRMADITRTGSLLSQRDGEPETRRQAFRSGNDADGCGEVCWVGDANDTRLERRRDDAGEYASQFAAGPSSPWSDLDWLPCSDGKARPAGAIESEFQPVADGLSDSLGLMRAGKKWLISPLSHGSSSRVGRLRAYGNAIVPYVASEFIAAFMECRP